MRILYGLVLAMGVGCADPVRLQSGFVQLSPPDTLVDLSASYERIYEDVKQCSGASGEFARVRWFYHPTEDFPIALDGETYPALSKWKTHRIFLGKTAGKNRFYVAHEILHELLQTNDHPPEYFEGRCGSLVSHGYKGGH